MHYARNGMRRAKPVKGLCADKLNVWDSEDGPGPGPSYEPPRGWVIPTPTIRDAGTSLTAVAQPGSRIYYISPSSGVVPNHATVMYYFWDGTNIIDNLGNTSPGGVGTPYGTDPLNPSGPVVAWKHWSAVGPCLNGAAAGVRTGDGGIANLGVGSYLYTGNLTTTRLDKPDWYLFKRGDTIDLTADLADYKLTATGFTTTDVSLSTLGGTTWGKKQVVGAYGSLATARPIIYRSGTSSFALIARQNGGTPSSWRNVMYMDLHFTSVRADSVSDIKFHSLIAVDAAVGEGTGFTREGSYNILLQGCLWEKMGSGPGGVNGGGNQIAYHRCAVIDTYNNQNDSTHGIGFGCSSGTNQARYQVSECFLARNGNKDTGTPPETLEAADTLGWNIFVRNNYWGGELDHLQSWFRDSISLRGGSGDQWRMGVRLENNFFMQGYVTNAGHGGYPDEDGPTGTMLDNVLQNFYDGGHPAHPGWMFDTGMGAADMPIVGNISTLAGVSNVVRGFYVSPISWGGSGYDYSYPTRRVKMYNNIFESGATKCFQFLDGIPTGEGGLAGEPAYVAPGVIDYEVTGNHVISTSAAPEWSYVQSNGGPTQANFLLENTISGNTTYASRTACTDALRPGGDTDPDYTLADYLTDNGETVSFGFGDGVQELIDIWKAGMRRGDWDDTWTAMSINNEFRRKRGFGARVNRYF
jgi:hypothetical protein